VRDEAVAEGPGPIFFAVLALAVLGLRAVFPLPDISDRAPSAAIAADPSSAFGARVLARAETDPGLTGVLPLIDGVHNFPEGVQ